MAAVSDVEALINGVSETSLSFSVDKDLSRMVVAVRAVGSDEIRAVSARRIYDGR